MKCGWIDPITGWSLVLPNVLVWKKMGNSDQQLKMSVGQGHKVGVLMAPSSSFCTLAKTTPVSVFGLHFDLSYTLAQSCDCISHGCDAIAFSKYSHTYTHRQTDSHYIHTHKVKTIRATLSRLVISWKYCREE